MYKWYQGSLLLILIIVAFLAFDQFINYFNYQKRIYYQQILIDLNIIEPFNDLNKLLMQWPTAYIEYGSRQSSMRHRNTYEIAVTKWRRQNCVVTTAPS